MGRMDRYRPFGARCGDDSVRVTPRGRSLLRMDRYRPRAIAAVMTGGVVGSDGSVLGTGRLPFVPTDRRARTRRAPGCGDDSVLITHVGARGYLVYRSSCTAATPP